jgi:hypothetical protein
MILKLLIVAVLLMIALVLFSTVDSERPLMWIEEPIETHAH